jgi:RTX calcium-binding nonapeptide repeat (4 copies)
VNVWTHPRFHSADNKEKDVKNGNTTMQQISRFGVPALSAGLFVAFMGVILGPANPTQAALIEGGKGPQLLIGLDDDRQDNTAIQAGAGANQSLNRTDILEGGQGNDVMFGLNGNDVMDGGPGRDIILGGPDGGAAPGGPPNSDIMFGGPDDDVNLWAPGDGSEAFVGGPGLDAIIFGSTDREQVADESTGVRLPTLLFTVPGFPQGIPTADVSGLANFCTLEASPSPDYDYLVRFRGRAASNIIVTVRVSEVEQVFCTDQVGGAIAFANLTDPSPAFVVVSQQEVATLNSLVAAMIR